MKYKLLVIDDEKLIREGLLHYLDWSALDVEEVQTAADGAEAIRLILEDAPDMILSDICMPNMDGTQLIQYLREQNIPSEVIFMSAYSEFKYAQTAVHYGAFDYLLKPITEQALTLCITKCIDKLKHTGAVSGNSGRLEALQNTLEVLYKTDTDYDDMFLHAFHAVTDCSFLQCNQSLLVYLQLENNPPGHLKALVEKLSPKASIEMPLYHNMFVYLLSDISLKQEYLQQYISEQYACAFVPLNTTTKNTLHQAIITAMYQIVKSICPSDVVPYHLTASTYSSYTHTLLTECLCNVNPSGLEQLLYSFWDYQYEEGVLHNFQKFLYQCISLVYMANKMTEENYGPLFEVSDFVSYDFAAKISATEHVADAFFVLYRCLYDIISQINARIGKNSIALQALNYLHDNYASELTLNQLAKHTALSPSYLSKLFKDNFKTSFSDYLLQYRMNIAKRMLTSSNSKIYEIAAAVGYQDVVQFSKMFKKTLGISPREWMKVAAAKPTTAPDKK